MIKMKKLLTIFLVPLFFILHSLFFPTPAQAQPASQHPDKNIKVRGWEPIVGQLNLIEFDHDIDPRAPQLSTLIAGEATPNITALYQVYEWDWTTNSRDGLYPRPPDAPLDFATLVSFAANGKSILVPESGYTLGSGLEVFVLYADANSITLQYTCGDSAAVGYTIHLVGFNIDGSLLAFYNQLDQAGRESLPALKAGARIGTGSGDILVAIRDTGSFMDPRWRSDWWQRLNAVSGQPLELTELSFDECGGGPPDEGCPVPDYDTDRCCPLEQGFNASSVLPGWLQTALNIFGDALRAVVRTTVKFDDNELKHAHVEELTQRYFGTNVSDFDDGVMKKLMPPNYLFIQSQDERQRVYRQWGKWEIDVEGEIEGEEDRTGIVEGADPHLYELDYAYDFLDAALTKIPGEEEEANVPLAVGDEELCHPVLASAHSSLIKVSDPKEESGEVLAAGEDLCHDVLEGNKHAACLGEETSDEGIQISFGSALASLLSGKIKVYPRFSFLRDIFFHTAGPQGLFRIFDLPGEEHDEYDGETEGDFKISVSLGVNVPTPPVPIPGWQPFWGISWDFAVENEAKVWETGTEKSVDDKIKQKLTPPTAEDSTTTYKAPSEPTIYLAANPTVQGSYHPQNISFAEKVGRTLGNWLGKLITL